METIEETSRRYSSLATSLAPRPAPALPRSADGPSTAGAAVANCLRAAAGRPLSLGRICPPWLLTLHDDNASLESSGLITA